MLPLSGVQFHALTQIHKISSYTVDKQFLLYSLLTGYCLQIVVNLLSRCTYSILTYLLKLMLTFLRPADSPPGATAATFTHEVPAVGASQTSKSSGTA